MFPCRSLSIDSTARHTEGSARLLGTVDFCRISVEFLARGENYFLSSPETLWHRFCKHCYKVVLWLLVTKVGATSLMAEKVVEPCAVAPFQPSIAFTVRLWCTQLNTKELRAQEETNRRSLVCEMQLKLLDGSLDMSLWVRFWLDFFRNFFT